MGLDDDILYEIVKEPSEAECRMLDQQPISYFAHAAHSLYLAENFGFGLGEDKKLKFRSELAQLTNEQLHKVIGLIDGMIEIYREAMHVSSNSDYYAQEIAIFNAVRKSLAERSSVASVEKSLVAIKGGMFYMPPPLQKAASTRLHILQKKVS